MQNHQNSSDAALRSLQLSALLDARDTGEGPRTAIFDELNAISEEIERCRCLAQS